MLFTLSLISSFILAPVVPAQLVSSNGAPFDRAGAAWSKDSNTFSFVAAMIQVPTVNGLDSTGASAYVAIDGLTCNVSLSAGVAFGVDYFGHAYHEAWYQWYPDNKTPHFLDTLAVSAGDSIDVVITSSTTSAVVTFWNYNNDQTETVSLTSVHALCGRDAGWIVQENTSPPVGFGMVNFTDAVAFGPSGLIYTPGDANSDLLSPQWSVQPEGDSLTVMPI